MTYLALTLPGNQTIHAPTGIPQGGLSTVIKVVRNSLMLFLVIAILLALIFFVLGGIQWITSGGDKQKLTKARARLTYAIVGLIIALGSFFLISIIGFFFNTNLLHIGN